MTLSGYDALNGVIYAQTWDRVGDESNYNTTAEDRFFGLVHYDGIKRVMLTNSSGGIEIDHLQYGR